MKELPIIGTLSSSEVKSTSSSSSEVKQFGASALYGLKLDDSLNQRINFDYDRGLLIQIFEADFSFEEYVRYINEPKHLVNPIRDIRLFDNEFCESLSKAAWYVIPIAYAPWMAWTIYQCTIYAEYTSPIALVL